MLITDRAQVRRPLADVLTAALAGGCRWVSLREKDLTGADQITREATPADCPPVRSLSDGAR